VSKSGQKEISNVTSLEDDKKQMLSAIFSAFGLPYFNANTSTELDLGLARDVTAVTIIPHIGMHFKQFLERSISNIDINSINFKKFSNKLFIQHLTMISNESNNFISIILILTCLNYIDQIMNEYIDNDKKNIIFNILDKYFNIDIITNSDIYKLNKYEIHIIQWYIFVEFFMSHFIKSNNNISSNDQKSVKALTYFNTMLDSCEKNIFDDNRRTLLSDIGIPRVNYHCGILMCSLLLRQFSNRNWIYITDLQMTQRIISYICVGVNDTSSMSVNDSVGRQSTVIALEMLSYFIAQLVNSLANSNMLKESLDTAER
jgi:hypothetical protein